MKINKNYMLYFIQVMFIIEPKIFTQYTIPTLIYSLANIIIFVVLLLKTNRYNGNVPKVFIFWIMLRVYLLMLMIINSNVNSLLQWGYLSLVVSNIILLINFATLKKEIKELLSAFTNVSIIYLIINLLSLLMFDNGIIPSNNIYDNGDNDIYFLGIKVQYTFYIISTLATAGLEYILYNKKKKFIFAILLSIVLVLYANISTGIICFLFGVILTFVQKKFKLKFSMKKVILFGLFINIAVIFFDIQNLFSYFIVNILHKNVSLTNRTYIWDKAIEIIKNQNILKTLFGNGLINRGAFVPLGTDYWPAHNQLLQLIYDFGIFGTCAFYSWLVSMDLRKKMTKEKNFLLIICATTMLGTVTNTFFNNTPIYVPFIFLYFIERISKNKVEEVK